MHLLLLLVVSGAPLADGEFWVLRKGHERPSRIDGRFTVSTWDFTCQRMEVKGPLVTLGPFTFSHRDGVLSAPSLETFVREVPLRGECRDAPLPPDRFASELECNAHGAPIVVTCEGGGCVSTAPFLSLYSCDPELRALTELAGLVHSVPHLAALHTLERLEAVMKRGGTLWERGACRAVSVSQRKGEVVRIRGAGWEVEGALEPLRGRARMRGARAWLGEGGLGVWGTGPSTEPLLLGRDLFILGRRVLFTDEAACVAERKKL